VLVGQVKKVKRFASSTNEESSPDCTSYKAVHRHTLQVWNYLYIFSIYIILQSKTAKLVCYCCLGVGMTQEFPEKLSALLWLNCEQLLHLLHLLHFQQQLRRQNTRENGIVMVAIQKCVGVP